MSYSLINFENFHFSAFITFPGSLCFVCVWRNNIIRENRPGKDTKSYTKVLTVEDAYNLLTFVAKLDSFN